MSDEQAAKLVRKLVGMGHYSPMEHVTFTFAIEGVSRVLTHQLVRHRIASYSQQSQRYVKELNIEIIMKEFASYIVKIIRNSNYNFNDEDIEEIASDVFLAIWKNQNKLDINKNISPYIVGVTKNIMLKRQRNNKKNIVNIEDFEKSLYNENDLYAYIENSEQNDVIMEELMKMKLEDRDIFTCYYYNAKQMKEIAMKLNITERKVKSRLFRIRRKLKRKLEERGYSNEG